MNLRVFLCGIAGGTLGSLALALPLYGVLPGDYTDDWPALSPALGRIGYVLAVLVTLATGHIAARWSWAGSVRDRIRTGALAGILASWIGFPVLGAAAAGVVGCGPMLRQPALLDDQTAESLALLTTVCVRVVWYTYLTGLAMTLAGTALGAMGGWSAGWGHAGNFGAAPRLHQDTSGETALLLAIVTWCLSLLLLPLFHKVATGVETIAAQHELATDFPASGVLRWPALMNLAILLILTSWLGCWCTQPAEKQEAARRLALLAVTALCFPLPLGAVFAIVVLVQPLRGDPLYLLGAGAMGLVGLFWLYRIQEAFDTAAVFPRVAVNTVLIAALMPVTVTATGVSCLLTAVGLYSSDIPRDSGSAIQAIFVYQWLASVGLTVLAVAAVVVIYGGSHWWSSASKAHLGLSRES